MCHVINFTESLMESKARDHFDVWRLILRTISVTKKRYGRKVIISQTSGTICDKKTKRKIMSFGLRGEALIVAWSALSPMPVQLNRTEVSSKQGPKLTISDPVDPIFLKVKD